jgi:hypothetical protein
MGLHNLLQGALYLYLEETGWQDVEWIHLAQDRVQRRAVANTVMGLQVPYEAMNFLNS